MQIDIMNLCAECMAHLTTPFFGDDAAKVITDEATGQAVSPIKRHDVRAAALTGARFRAYDGTTLHPLAVAIVNGTPYCPDHLPEALRNQGKPR